MSEPLTREELTLGETYCRIVAERDTLRAQLEQSEPSVGANLRSMLKRAEELTFELNSEYEKRQTLELQLETATKAVAELARRQEICICAAVQTLNGQTIRGHRHNYCLATIAAMGLQPQIGPDTQGFMTSKNRFVTRKEGLQLQRDAGIASAAGDYRGDELYSEDLY